MSDEIEFVDGLIFKLPGDNAPDFVKGKLSIKRKELGNWLRGKDDEWINIDLKISKSGKPYASVDNWKPEGGKSDDMNDPVPAAFDSDVPF